MKLSPEEVSTPLKFWFALLILLWCPTLWAISRARNRVIRREGWMKYLFNGNWWWGEMTLKEWVWALPGLLAFAMTVVGCVIYKLFISSE